MVACGTVGLDEAGKGDYFGPLVVAAVCGEPARLAAVGVADSKRMSDGKCTRLAQQVQAGFATEVVAINPPKYNDLYARIKNLNHLLAWAHARALENMLAHVTASEVVADQFANMAVLEGALLERGREVALRQMPRAETHPSVAAASVVARAEFLSRLAGLSRQHGVDLPKGAGPQVDAAGAEVLRRGGVSLLRQVAKLHFKNTRKIGVATSQHS